MTIMENDKVFLFVPPDAFALDQEGATLGHEGNKSGRSTVLGLTIVGRLGGRAAAALLTLLMPVAPLSAFGSAAGDASGLAAVCLDVCGSCKLALLP